MYHKIDLSFDQVPQFSKRDKAFQLANPALRPFYEYDVSIDQFKQVVAKRQDFDIDRPTLVTHLLQQYNDLPNNAEAIERIEMLRDKNTYTVITAHQPSLLTGPLYFIYKICSILSLSKQLNDRNEGYKVVPVFIMGGEDHDFEEIATMHLFGRDFTWKTDQKGSTARMNLDGLEKVLSEVFEKLGASEHATKLEQKIRDAFANSKNYGSFMFRFVHSIFQDHGLIIANMDSPDLKQRLLPYVLQDLDGLESKESVEQDQKAIIEAGFKDQAHAREVNIFWMSDDRHRVIDLGEENYRIGEDVLNKEALEAKLRTHPERISPNVILRPVYQEIVFPNLAYVGGGGELAYWLERKTLFQKWNIPFPMLIRRDSVKIVDRKTAQWLSSNQLSINDLFQREEQLVGAYSHARSTVQIDLSSEREELLATFAKIEAMAGQIDQTLVKTVSSESAKLGKSFAYLENKMLKAVKQKNEVGINRLVKIKRKLFPGNDGLQERYDNFIAYYLKYGDGWINDLLKHLDPMNKNFKILIED